MDSKFRLKIGPIEIEQEGSEEFQSEKLLSFIAETLKILKTNNIQIVTEIPASPPINGGAPASENIQGTTSTLAAKLGCSSGSEMVIATASHLTFVKRQQTFSRQNLIDEMKTAAGYFKQSYIHNLSSSLQTLVKNGKLLESSKDTYSLSETAKKELEIKLAA